MAEFYDKNGNPLTILEWVAFFKQRSDPPYKRVAETTLLSGKWVSTVWLGCNHQYGDGPPLIFETKVFQSQDKLNEYDMDRYSTIAEAEAGHIVMVGKWKSKDAIQAE